MNQDTSKKKGFSNTFFAGCVTFEGHASGMHPQWPVILFS
jgi:hypothetical protein